MSACAIRHLQTLRRVFAEVKVRFHAYSSGPRIRTRWTESVTNRRRKARYLSFARSRFRHNSS
jgi:hypothetical protein